jgi:hypothetical protein
VTARERLLVAIAAVVIPGLFTWRVAGPRWEAWADEARRQRSELELEADAAQELLEGLPATFDTVEVRTNQLMGVMSRLAIGEPASEAAGLRRALEVQARDRGLVVLSSSSEVDSLTTGLATSFFVRLDGEGDVVGLANWLRAIEEGEPTLVVREMSILATDVEVPQTGPETLRFAIRVEGVALHAPHWGGER